MVSIAKLTRKRLGELLVEEGLLKEEQVAEALKQQKATGKLLGALLVELGWVSEYDIARTIAKQFGLPYLDASKYAVSKDVADIVSSEFMYSNQLIVLDKMGGAVIIAVSGLIDQGVFEELEKKFSSKVFIYVSTVSQVAAVLKKNYPNGAK